MTDPQLHRYIVYRIKRELEARGMVQAELARRTGIPQRTMSHALMATEPFDFNVAELDAIVRALDITLDALLPEDSALRRRAS
jgi:transcriptional regulator with XRE-family HTH domain